MKVSEIMTRDMITIGMDESLRRIKKLFEEHGFHHLLVVENQKVLGVISDRDLLRNVSPFIDRLSERSQDLDTLNRRAHQIMSYNPITITSNKRVEEAAKTMLVKGVSCLPVVTRDGYPVGIVTWRDLLRSLCKLIP